MSDQTATRELTYGEKACGVNFNPGGNPDVDVVKRHYAELVDGLHARRETATNPEVKRMLSVAITEAQTSQMWAIKAITWSHA